MATHSGIHAWGIPWTEEPRRLQSLGSHRVRYDWSDLARTHTPPSWVSFPPPQSYPSMSSQSTKLNSLCYRAASHQLSILYMAVYTCQYYSPSFSPSSMSTCLFSTSVSLFLPYKQVHLYYFCRFHMCVNIYLFFSFWLISLHMTLVHPHQQMTHFIFCYDWVISHCIYIYIKSSLSIHLLMDI